MSRHTFVSRAIEGEFGPLEDENEAALLAVFNDYLEASKVTSVPLVGPSGTLGMASWEAEAVALEGHPVAPILRAQREAREKDTEIATLRASLAYAEAQLATLGTLVCEAAAHLAWRDATTAREDLTGASNALCHVEHSSIGLIPAARHAWAQVRMAARAMGVEVEE